MPTFRCRLFEVDELLPPDTKPKEQTSFSVPARNADDALKQARKYMTDRGRVVRACNITHNRLELVVYVWKKRPKGHLDPRTVRESELRKGS